MGDLVDTRQRELKAKCICRFCFSEDDVELTDIYGRRGEMESISLPLQVMACTSIEVFSTDCMPSKICNECRAIFDYFYRFTQMCKKADTYLRHYPITGICLKAMEKPKFPSELLRKPSEESNIKCLPPFIEKSNFESEHDKSIPPQHELQEEINSEPECEVKQKQNLPNEKPSQNNKKGGQHEKKQQMSKNCDNYRNIEVVSETLDPNEKRTASDPVNIAVVKTNVFPCLHCERSFPLRQLLDIHMVNHNRDRCFNCSDCDKSFFTKVDLQRHALLHTDERPFKCSVCDKGFTRLTRLLCHEKIHTDVPKSICIYCGQAFISNGQMEQHIRRQHIKRPFKCKMCDKTFTLKQGQDRHELVHHGVQPFQCQYCDQSFPTSRKLYGHLKAHAGARPFPCKLCPRSFSLSQSLSEHMRWHKKGVASYKCNDCDKSFCSSDDLNFHSAVHATQTMVCPLCKDAFDDIESVTEHVKEHAEGEAFACDFCDLVFLTADRLQEHTDDDHMDEIESMNGKQNIGRNGKVMEEYLIGNFSDPSRAKTKSFSNIAMKKIECQTVTHETAQTTKSKKHGFFVDDDECNSICDESTDCENIKDMSETMETPVKVSKVSARAQRVTKRALPQPEALPHKPVKKLATPSPFKNKSPDSKIGMSPAASTTLNTRQRTIQDALQGLPRSVSVKRVPVATKLPQTDSKSEQPNKSVAASTILREPSTDSQNSLSNTSQVKASISQPISEEIKMHFKKPMLGAIKNSSCSAGVVGDKDIIESE